MHSVTLYWGKNTFILKSLRTFRTRIRSASHVDETGSCARTRAQTFSLNFYFRDVYVDVTTYSLRTYATCEEDAFIPNKSKTITENRDKEYML